MFALHSRISACSQPELAHALTDSRFAAPLRLIIVGCGGRTLAHCVEVRQGEVEDTSMARPGRPATLFSIALFGLFESCLRQSAKA